MEKMSCTRWDYVKQVGGKIEAMSKNKSNIFIAKGQKTKCHVLPISTITLCT